MYCDLITDIEKARAKLYEIMDLGYDYEAILLQSQKLDELIVSEMKIRLSINTENGIRI